MPFGKRMGSHQNNTKLYPILLEEFARVLKVESGRAVLLSFESKLILKKVREMGLWTLGRKFIINQGQSLIALSKFDTMDRTELFFSRKGGLDVHIFLLQRTSPSKRTQEL